MLRPIVSRPGRAAGTLLAVVGAAVLLLGTSEHLLAQNKRSDSKVKATATATKPDADGKQTITVTLDIEKGWHLYANPVGFEDFEPNATVVTVTGKAKPQAVKVEYPPGDLHKDDILKATYRTYEGRVTIRAHVQRAAGDTGPLEVSVKVNACDARMCLPQAEIKLAVP
jgi:DsbC/DsbD-like thiol-disulfide interchange protein